MAIKSANSNIKYAQSTGFVENVSSEITFPVIRHFVREASKVKNFFVVLS